MRGTSPTEPVIAPRAHFFSHAQMSADAPAGSLRWVSSGQVCLKRRSSITFEMLPLCPHTGMRLDALQPSWSWIPATAAMLPS